MFLSKLKTVMLLLLAVAALVGAVGCGSKEETPAPDGKPAKGMSQESMQKSYGGGGASSQTK